MRHVTKVPWITCALVGGQLLTTQPGRRYDSHYLAPTGRTTLICRSLFKKYHAVVAEVYFLEE